MAYHSMRINLLSLLVVSVVLCLSCNNESKMNVRGVLTLFYASGFAPVIESLKEPLQNETGIELHGEASGSVEACRKISDLGRRPDMIMVADSRLIFSHLKEQCDWRIDFASDEIVLACGARCPNIELAYKDWTRAIIAPEARLARVSESMAPLGYWGLLAFKLKAQKSGDPELYNRFVQKCSHVVDDASRLVPLLRNGEADYAFAFRSICIANAISFIALEPSVNLGDPDSLYNTVSVSYAPPNHPDKPVTVTGSPILWSLSILKSSRNKVRDRAFVEYLLKVKKDALSSRGFRILPQLRFHGSREEYVPFSTIALFANDE